MHCKICMQVGSVDWGYGAAGGQRLEQRFATSLSCRCRQLWFHRWAWQIYKTLRFQEKHLESQAFWRNIWCIMVTCTYVYIYLTIIFIYVHLWCNTYIFQHDTVTSLWFIGKPIPSISTSAVQGQYGIRPCGQYPFQRVTWQGSGIRRFVGVVVAVCQPWLGHKSVGICM